MSSRPPESEGTKETRQEFEQARAEATRYASETAEDIEQRGREGLEKAKHGAADKTEELAEAIERTADDLGSGDDAISGYGHSMASMMRRFAGGLREHDIEEFAGELAGFARRNPGSFLAGSVALGFGLSRFLKASSHHESGHAGGRYGYEDEEYAFEDEDYFGEELGAEPDEGLHSATTEFGGGAGGEAGERSGGRWPEDRESPTPGSEYQAGSTGQPPLGAGGQQPNEPGGMHRE